MYVTRGGVRLYYQVTGNGGRDLFLLPQVQPVTYSRQWKYQIPYLSRYFRVATMDHRGNGRSDRPATGYDLDSRYEDLLAVLEGAVRPPFALVAYACAGMLAFRYAVEHPERISRIVIMETGPFTGHQRMSDAWFAFRDFVRDNEDVPVGMLIRGGCKNDPGDEVVAA